MTKWAQRRYGATKTAGLCWVDRVPSHWEIKRLKFTVNGCYNGIWGVEPDGGDSDIACVRVADFDRVRFRVNVEIPTVRSVSQTERRKRVLCRGDLLLEKSGGGELQPVGAVVVFEQAKLAVSSNFVARLPVKPSCDARFLTYVHATLYAGGVNKRSIRQTTGIQNLDSDSYLSEHVPLPPLPEQRTIATFLDRETARVDALIEKKRLLIELLQEKRAAIIGRAVTTGLDRHAALRESSVPWLGLVPRHWAVAPVRARYEVVLGKMLDEKRIQHTALAPYLRNVDVQWSGINVYDLPEMDFGTRDRKKFSLRRGDLLVCEGGEVGRTAIWEGQLDPCFFQKALHRLRPTVPNRDDPRFMKYLMRWAAEYGIFAATGNANTIDHLTADKLRKHRFGFPPMDEQRSIADSLDGETVKIDRLIDRQQAVILLLSERRTALIAAAVTGQIDVREAA